MMKNIVLIVLGLAVVWFFAVSLPLWIAAAEFGRLPISLGGLRFVGWIPITLGASAILVCYATFLSVGKGTPWPFDPPRRLVTTGLYRLTRNPMEGGFLLVVLGEVLWFESSVLLLYGLCGFLYFHWRQVFVEEPALVDRFGECYERYRDDVPRWIPRVKIFTKEE